MVPFFATATMEREVFEGSVATANVDAKLLSGLQGMPHIVTVDLHTMQNQFFFHGCTLFFSFVFFVFCFFFLFRIFFLKKVVFPSKNSCDFLFVAIFQI